MTPRKLDRLVQFDERSRAFPISTVVPAKPRSYTWSVGGVWLDQGSEGACFPPNTMIRMADGSHKPIEQIRLLDEVVTAEGRAGQVLQTMVRWHADDMVAVRLRGLAAVKMTPEHPVLTKRGYIKAADLAIGDYAAVTRHPIGLIAEVDITPLITLRRSPSHALAERVAHQDRWGGVTVSEVVVVPQCLVLNASLGRLFGLYLAEGHTTENKVILTFGKHERETLAPEAISLFKETLGATARMQIRPNGVVNVVLYGKVWRQLFGKLFGTGAGAKTVGALASGPPEFLHGLVDGWIAGDGHSRRTARQGTSVSRALAYDMHGIGQALGLRPVISRTEPQVSPSVKSRRPRYDVCFPLGGGLNLPDQDDAATWRRVTGLDHEPSAGFVFNLHVSGDNSYVAGGLGVHNCVGFGWAHELMARPAVMPHITDEFARRIYREAQRVDEWEGEAYDGTSVLAGAKIVKALGAMTEYRWCFGVDDLRRAVGFAGPCVIGVNWYSGMFDADAKGYVHVTGVVEGGHCVCIFGNNEPGKFFKGRNSWGAAWGQNGNFFISHDDMARLLAEQGEACVPMGRKRISA